MKTFIALMFASSTFVGGYFLGINNPTEHGVETVECPSTSEAFRKGVSAGIEDGLNGRAGAPGEFAWEKHPRPTPSPSAVDSGPLKAVSNEEVR